VRGSTALRSGVKCRAVTDLFPSDLSSRPTVAAPVTTGPPCRYCLSTPATDVTFRSHTGLVVLMQFASRPGPFCRDCGRRAFRDMTSHTLVWGWWGLISAVAAPATILLNLVRSRRLNDLSAPVPNPERPIPPQNPGKPLLRRWTTVGALVPLVALAFFAVVVMTPEPAPQSCVLYHADKTIDFVSCSGKHDGEVLKVVTNTADCPRRTTSTFELVDEDDVSVDGKHYCVRDLASN
jgi:hypothetical protein